MLATIPWNAASYDQVSTVQQEWGRRVLAGMDLEGGETALDAGCGTGRLADLLAEALPHGRVLAVDHSAEMLSVARRRSQAPVSLVQADLCALPFLGSLDLIFSNAVFHWIQDHARLFGSLFAALKPGGRLVAQCGGHGNLEEAHAVVYQLISQPRFARYFRGWREPYRFATPEETAALLRAAGFTEVDTSLTPAPTPFPSRETFRDFVGTVILRSFQGPLPPQEHGAFVENFVEACPRYHLDYVRLNLSARRP